MTANPRTTPMHGSRCVWTSKAIDAMKDGKPGDKITLERMSAIVGRDCSNNGRGRGNVMSAINHIESTYGITWKWSRADQAWIALAADGKLAEARARGESGARKIRRGLRVAATIDPAQLDTADRATLNKTMFQLEMARTAMSAPMAKRIEQSGKVTPPTLDEMAKLMQAK